MTDKKIIFLSKIAIIIGFLLVILGGFLYFKYPENKHGEWLVIDGVATAACGVLYYIFFSIKNIFKHQPL
ncbi:MAG: hypothetical protein ISR98_02105 [Parcubacteria group bacterium]|nr:hypothetical protein [Parcubacteria group bacterium]